MGQAKVRLPGPPNSGGRDIRSNKNTERKGLNKKRVRDKKHTSGVKEEFSPFEDCSGGKETIALKNGGGRGKEKCGKMEIAQESLLHQVESGVRIFGEKEALVSLQRSGIPIIGARGNLKLNSPDKLIWSREKKGGFVIRRKGKKGTHKGTAHGGGGGGRSGGRGSIDAQEKG